MHAILVHGWRGWPENAWFPWLREELEKHGWTVDVPSMPEPMVPERRAWVGAIERSIERALEQGIPASKITILGHSLGCPAILFVLERHQGKPFGHVVFVSGFGRSFGAPGVEKWMDHEMDFENIRPKAIKWTVLHGAGDVVVPMPEGRWLAEQLNATFTPTEWPGHFMHEEGITELPEALAAIIQR